MGRWHRSVFDGVGRRAVTPGSLDVGRREGELRWRGVARMWERRAASPEDSPIKQFHHRRAFSPFLKRGVQYLHLQFSVANVTCSNCSLGREGEAGQGGGEWHSPKEEDKEVEGEWHGEMMLMGNGNVGEELLNTWVLVLSSQHEFRAHHLKIGLTTDMILLQW